MWTERRSGNNHQRGKEDNRNPFERDRTRVIHCPAFRRLQRKTQILGTDGGDFHRTRLTHSLEVASIGTSIKQNMSLKYQDKAIADLLPNDDLIQVICLLHDIGHPPFGHGGEAILNFLMRNHGGFESNAQTLRLLTKFEHSYGDYGLDLTRRTLFGILKYPVSYSKALTTSLPPAQESGKHILKMNGWMPPKAYFDNEALEVAWMLLPFSEKDKEHLQSFHTPPDDTKHGQAAYKGLDCSIMNLADDIAYGVHDLEDAIHLELIHPSHLDTETFRDLLSNTSLQKNRPHLIDGLFSSNQSVLKQTIGEMVNYFINATDIHITHESFENSMLKYNLGMAPEARALLDYLKHCIYDNVIDSQEARIFEHGGQMTLLRLFEAISSNPDSLLDSKNRVLYRKTLEKDEAQALRIICDYIANMTDEFAFHMHEKLFGFNTRKIS